MLVVIMKNKKTFILIVIISLIVSFALIYCGNVYKINYLKDFAKAIIQGIIVGVIINAFLWLKK